jgi:hypothetical protein
MLDRCKTFLFYQQLFEIKTCPSLFHVISFFLYLKEVPAEAAQLLLLQPGLRAEVHDEETADRNEGEPPS